MNDVELAAAAAEGNLAKIKQLLAAGANKNAQDPFVGLTPLICAAAGGHKAVVEALLAAGADKRARTKTGDTALDAARSKGHTAVVDLLARG